MIHHTKNCEVIFWFRLDVDIVFLFISYLNTYGCNNRLKESADMLRCSWLPEQDIAQGVN